jgi:hypothetical protein
MKKLCIAIKTKTKLIKELESLYEIDYYKELSLFEKLIFKEKKAIDIYFHQGVINEKALKVIGNSSKIIVNSNSLKNDIIKKIAPMNESKIYIIYPPINTSMIYDKQIKKEFKIQYSIHKNERIIYFTGKNLKVSGISKFLAIIKNLDKNNFKIIIDTDSLQIKKLKSDIDKLNLIDKFILLENYTNKEELFIASDIFILPTKQKLFSQNILKAMYYQNAVFVMKENASSELLDSFSLIYSEDDPSTSFKIDGLLNDKKELKNIKKQNYTIANKYNLKNSMEKIKQIIIS